MKTKSLLILDLESTCFERGKEVPGFFSEIIEIGAVSLNLESLKIDWEFQKMVKPTLFPILSTFCKQLTTLTQEEADQGISLSEAFEELKIKIKKEDYIFASWGFYDKRQIQRNCERFQIPYPFGPEHISLKHEFGKWMKTKPMGMAGALRILHLPLVGTHHRGLDDARNIAQIAIEMIRGVGSHLSHLFLDEPGRTRYLAPPMKAKAKIRKILIANRGEIAVRVIRACREMEIKTVAVYSDADRAALHVRRADEAYHIGPNTPSESYLNVAKIIDAAKKSGADAIHPGYGFLSENADFAEAIEKAGLIFIGPNPQVIRAMGSKIEARKIAQKAGVPIVPGIERPLSDVHEAIKVAKEIGFPVLLKAAAGGGGKGMRAVQKEEDLKSAFEMAQSEAIKSFKDGAIYIEKYVEGPHHIEVQVFGDMHGNVMHFFERECSVQRRHQKVIEESPSPFISDKTRKAVCNMAVQLCKPVNYYNAGTIECLVDKYQNYYFLEMNTRLQVEHPVTEMVTGVDLVKLQILVAQGEALPFKQEDIKQTGHAIECRVYAEDPFHNFMPAPGLVIDQQYPHGPGVRLDNGIYQGFQIPLEYDPVLSKLICWGRDRAEAIERTKRALTEYRVSGPKTNLYFHRRALEVEDFLKGNYDTHFVSKHLDSILKIDREEKTQALMAAALSKYLEDEKRKPTNPVNGKQDASAWRLSGRMEGMRK